MVLAIGLLFDFPIVLVGLIRLRVVTTKALARMRKLVIVSIFIAGWHHDTPDPVSQILLGFPLLVLFEIFLWLGRFVEKKWTKKTAECV